MTNNEKNKITELLQAAQANDPASMTPLVNSILANKIKTILDEKKKEVMSNF